MKKYLLAALLFLLSVAAFAQAPLINGFSPLTGPVGSSVAISGMFFNTTPSANLVYFGGVKANVTAATSTSLTVTVPLGATYDPVYVVNTANNLSRSSVAPFVVTTADSRGTVSSSDFDPKADYVTGVTPQVIGMADIDGDGKTDIAVLNNTSNTISLYRNTAVKGILNTSSFTAKVDIATGSAPSAVALKDLDGDGKPELIVTNKSGNSVSVYHNNAVSGVIDASTFGQKTDFATANNPASLAIGDLDGDGKPDIAVANGGTVSVLLNSSAKGTINSSSFLAKNDMPFAINSIIIADLDGDARNDIAGLGVLGASYAVSIFHNIGTVSGSIAVSSFESSVNFSTGALPSVLKAADLNGDGKLELVTIDKIFNVLTVLKNSTNGAVINSNSFLQSSTFSTGKSPYDMAFYDIDGDGLVDVLTANYADNTLSIFHNITTTSGNTPSFAAKDNMTFTGNPMAVAIGDLDGDGRPDIGAVNLYGSLSIFRYNPPIPPAITGFSPLTGPVGTTVTITGTNFNTDNIANNIIYFGATRAVVTAATSTQIITTVPVGATYKPITLVNSDTRRGAASQKPFDVTYTTKNSILTSDFATPGYGGYLSQHSLKVNLLDVDGDGKPDMVTCDLTAKTVSVWLNTGTVNAALNGQFAPALTFDGGDAISDLKIADIDGDGKPDIVTISNMAQTISILHNISTPANAAFDKRINMALPNYVYFDKIELADLNTDGKIDIIAWSATSYFYVYRNTSSITTISFAAPLTISADVGNHLTTGDVDGDGKPDIVLDIYYGYSNNSNNGLSVMRNTSVNGGISFTTPVLINSTVGGPVLADIDSDGKLDIITGNGTSINILRNLSSGGPVTPASFSAPVPLNTNQQFGGACYVADIDGDGKPDIISSNGDLVNHSTFSILRNTTVGSAISFDDGIDIETRLACGDMAIGDIDGDSKPDILVNTGNYVMPFYNHPLSAAATTPPVITAITPSSGAAGSTVTITGNNFNPSASGNFVTFGDLNAKITSASANSLQVIVPVAATYSTVSVINKSNGLVTNAAKPFYTTFTSKNDITIADFNPPFNIATSPVSSSINSNILLSDIDGDGKLDLIISYQLVNPSGNKVAIYRNISTTGTLSQSSFAAPIEFTNMSGLTAMKDVDGDGKPDLLYYYSNGYFQYFAYYPNTSTPGNIKFDTSNFIGTPMPSSGVGITGLTDIDGDGRPDIIGVGGVSPDAIWVFHNTSYISTFNFGIPKSFTAGASVSIYNIAQIDLDGDGEPDIVTANRDGSISILKNTSTPGLSNNHTFSPAMNIPKLVTAYYGTMGALADIDGDGKPDIVVIDYQTGTVSLLQNTSTIGNISFAQKVNFSVPNARSATINDFDGDGKPDILVTTTTGLTILRNTSTAGAFSASSLASPVNFTCTAQTTLTGDLDGDGKADIVTVSYNNAVTIYQNNPHIPGKPVITGFTPQAGTNGTTVTITGTDFDKTSAVTFGGTPAASFTLVSPFTITAVVGGGTTGSVSVTTPMGTATLAGFTYVPQPTISANGPTFFLPGGNVLLTANPSTGYAYQWQKDGVNITGATTPTYSATQSGSYTVSITLAGITANSPAVKVIASNTLPPGNFAIRTTSATCKGSANGMVKIVAAQHLGYTATVTGGGLNTPYPFTDSVSIPNLAAGTYNVCMTVAGQSSYQQCFSVVITEPKDLSVYAASVTPGNQVVLTLNGGTTYHINLNGNSITTSASSVTLSLAKGTNTILVSTDKACQGVIEKDITVSDETVAYPNPFDHTLNLVLGKGTVKLADIVIFGTDGRQVYSNSFTNLPGSVQLDLPALKAGLYVLKLSADGVDTVFKIVKK